MAYSRKKPHVLVVMMQHSGGGAERQSILVAEAVKEAFEVTMAVAKPVPDAWRMSMEAKGFSVTVLQDKDTFLQRRLRHRRLVELCATLEPDLVYSRWIKLNVGLAKAKDRGDLKCGVIIQVANTLSKLLDSTRLSNLLFKKSICSYYPKADLILCNGNLARIDLINEFGLGPEKCLYLPNLLEVGRVHCGIREHGRSRQDDHLRIVSVGRLIAQKDYTTLLRAVAKISGDVPLSVEIFGNGPYKRKIERDIVKYRLGDVVMLKGPVSNPETFFPDFDLLVSSSLYEGMSNVMLEAMAEGLPVVVSEVSGSRDVLTNSSQGVVFPPGDADKLGSILKSLALDRERLIMLSREGSRRAADFVVPKLRKKYEEVFLSVLSKDWTDTT
ncbi:MAG: glycosyltransferase [Deltaproteobacteria bacterium]|nr:glycosyltransferase [Deltaproteobacteria bacterium]